MTKMKGSVLVMNEMIKMKIDSAIILLGAIHLSHLFCEPKRQTIRELLWVTSTHSNMIKAQTE